MKIPRDRQLIPQVAAYFMQKGISEVDARTGSQLLRDFMRVDSLIFPTQPLDYFLQERAPGWNSCAGFFPKVADDPNSREGYVLAFSDITKKL